MLRSSPLFVLVWLLVAVPAAAQSPTITGVVVDDRTNQPIRGVLVFVEGRDISAETDAGGRFALNAPAGPQTVAASVVGYAFLRAEVTVGAAPLDMTIRLSQGAGAYKESVTVSGTRLEEADAVPGDEALFGRELEQLRGLMLDDPLRAMQALPSATATDDFYSEFAVRGNTWRHVGLAVDGMPTRYLMHTVHGVTDGGSIAMINSETLGSAALRPGSYPQRTGRHLGAHVDLTMRDGNREEFRGRAGLSGTSATLLGEGPIAGGRGSWLASIRRSYLDYLIRRIEPDASFAFGFYDAQTRVVFDVTSRHQLSVTLLGGRSMFDENAEGLDDNDRQNAVSHAWLAAAAWRYTPSSRFAVTQRLYTTGYDFDTRNPFDTTLEAAGATDVVWRADASLQLAPRVLLEGGGDAQRLSARNFFSRRQTPTGGQVTLNRFNRRASAASGYVQARIDVTSRLRVTPGVRADRWTLTSANTASPWLTAELRLTDATRVRGGGGIYRQFATLDQAYGLRGGGTGLRPERAVHADTGVEHVLAENLRLSVTAYTRTEDDVLWMPGTEARRLPSGAVAQAVARPVWVNALDGRARGVEMLLRRDAPSGLSGWAGYAYGRHRYTRAATGETFWSDADQRHTVAIYGSYRLSSRTGFSAKFRYGSNYPLQGYVQDDPAAPVIDGVPQFYRLSAARNTARLPAYARFDVRADRAFTWSGRRLVLFAEVANILGRTNLRNTPPYRSDRQGIVTGMTEGLMPIVPSAGFVVEF